jgi:hypothetical protein
VASALFTFHARALQTLHTDLESYGLGAHPAFVGTAGSIIERANASGFRFFAHQFYDGNGKKRERYLAGPVGSPAAEAAAEALRERIRELKDLVPSFRMLGREGFHLVDGKTYAILASLHNHGVFAAGAQLVGSHAYGVLLNRLGAHAAAYTTEDIDIARQTALAFETPAPRSFLEMLRASGVDFVEVPELNRRQGSTSFKQRGRSLFHVDLLVPSPDDAFSVVAVPELEAHAMALPHLGYLLSESQMAMLLAREGCCAVRVPLPERFAVHKLVVSQLRRGREAKSGNDVLQACVVAAVLAESHPGALESAVTALPRRARRHLQRGREAARGLLEMAHPRAWEELQA